MAPQDRSGEPGPDQPSQPPSGAGGGQPAAGGGLRPCPRHPDRLTGISCTRCERPVCPQCMHQAAVGFHCPDCVRQGSASVRTPTTRYGGRVVGDTGLVTKVLLGLNVLVFVLGQRVLLGEPMVEKMLLVRGPVLGLGVPPEVIGVAVGPEQWYRMVSAVFLHEQIWHIAMNMLALWLIGPQLEAVLGRARYLGLYLASGLGGASLFVLSASPNAASLGASGAVFGLFGAMLVLTHRQKLDLRPVLVLIGVNLAVTFIGIQYIDWRGHVGGLVVGALVAAGLAYAPRAHRTLVQSAVLVGALGLAVGSALAVS